MAELVQVVAIVAGLALGGGNVMLLARISYRMGRLCQGVEDLTRRIEILERRNQERRAA